MMIRAIRFDEPRGRAAAFTIAEVLAALAVLAVAVALVAEVGYRSMRERTRNRSRQAALEVAGNVLEAARVVPWEELTPEWAAARRLPDDPGPLLPSGELTVQVEPEKDQPRTRRVTVEVRWRPEQATPAQSVRLVSLFSARSAAVTEGGKP